MFRRCCCGGGGTPCEFLVDDFNRADDTDIGSDWDETSGSWAISSNALVGSSAGRCETVAGRPDAATKYTVEATITDTGRILFDVDGTGNYHYIEMEISGSGTAFRLLFGNQSGQFAFTSFAAFATYMDMPYTRVYIKVCVSGASALVNYGNLTTGFAVINFTPVNGLLAGVGTSSSATIEDFSFKHMDASCSECEPWCNSACCSDSTATEYVVDFGAMSLTDNGCSDMDLIGGEYTLSNNGNCLFVYSEVITCSTCTDPCNPDPALNMSLQLSGCVWTLTIRIGDLVIEDPDCDRSGCDSDQITYSYTMGTNPSDCRTLDVTMSKTFEDGTPDTYTGTWPSTIQLTAA